MGIRAGRVRIISKIGIIGMWVKRRRGGGAGVKLRETMEALKGYRKN